jgi:hypothetical protein
VNLATARGIRKAAAMLNRAVLNGDELVQLHNVYVLDLVYASGLP